MIVIVDYGMGNLRSILHKLHKCKIDAIISSIPSVVASADKLILPGVGHFAQGMENLRTTGILAVLNEKVLDHNTPILGICLGAQLFTRFSEEGDVEGLGWLNAETRRFNHKSSNETLKVPHIGWNTLRIQRPIPALASVQIMQRFYFVHSYHIVCHNTDDIVATTHYGYDFASVVHKDAILGTQFHPEKSHRIGFSIIEDFCRQ